MCLCLRPKQIRQIVIMNSLKAVLVSLGFLISFGIRCNVGVALVKILTNSTGSPAEPNWSPQTIGYVDSAFFWGYVVTQVPGGFLASHIPANRVFGVAILLSSCLNLLLPTVMSTSPLLVIILRVLQVRKG